MKLYIYDHCPYCVKARIIFGLKNIEFELITLLNDDEKTPISMIGQKMLPILQKDDESFMAESLDIISYIDDNFGKEKVIKKHQNLEIDQWLNESSEYIYLLAMPRWAKSELDEFKTDSAKQYFTKKKESYIGPFTDAIRQSPSLVKKANQHLLKLEKILEKHSYPQDNFITEQDIHLFAALRSISIVKNINYPDAVNKYRHNLSKISNIDLHDNIAI